MLEGERPTPPEVVEELEPVEVNENEEGEANPRGEAAFYPHPTQPDMVVGPEQTELYVSPESLAEKPHGQGPKPTADAPISGANSNPPLDPGSVTPGDTGIADDATDDSTQQFLDDVADMRAAEEQALQEEVAALDAEQRPAYMDIAPEPGNSADDNYPNPADYQVDYSLLDNVSDEEQEIFDLLNDVRVEEAEAMQEDASAVQQTVDDTAVDVASPDEID